VPRRADDQPPLPPYGKAGSAWNRHGGFSLHHASRPQVISSPFHPEDYRSPSHHRMPSVAISGGCRTSLRSF
jgi:hypothetical protein